jgi:TolB-like protein/tetratricopeptide (TPR) repeat protein
MPPSDSPQGFRFGDYELDLGAYELRRRGRPVRLERRPMDLLILLLERRHQLVARTDIVERLWGTEVFVDVEMGINTAVRKVRQALRDAPTTPTFVQTVPNKGYRFIGDVEVVNTAPQNVPTLVTLAVLPFENIGSDPERDYLCDGLTEEMIASLGQIDPGHLNVIGRTSVLVYRRTTKTLAEIGRELGATYLIESSVRTESGRLRITSRLIRAEDQVQVWSDSYDSVPSSVLKFQRELSTTIAQHIRLCLPPGRLTVLELRQTRDVEAYDMYLRGRYFWNQLSPSTTRKAMEYYARATERDPEYALAWSGMADAYAASPINGDADPLDVSPRARSAAANAILAGPNLAEAETSSGIVKFFLDWDYVAAETAFRRSIAVDPNYSVAHRMLAILLAHTRRYEEACPVSRRARELDPLNAAHHAISAQVAFAGHDYPVAVQFAQQAIAIDPEFWIGHFQLGQAYEQMGEIDLALDALNNAGRFSGGNSKAISLRGYIFAKMERTTEACDVLHTLQAVASNRYVPPYAMALVHAGLGRPDDAFASLQQAVDGRDVHLMVLPIDPKWDPFRSDNRFLSITRRCAFQ